MAQQASQQQAQRNPTQDLINAIRQGKLLAEIQTLIPENDTKDSVVNGSDQDGVTPLMYAAWYQTLL